jgi:hypothetical protein
MSTTLRTFEPGSAYKDGKLYLFDMHGVLVVRAWPDPRAWRLGLEGPWKGARPIGLDLAAPDKLRASSRRRLRCQAEAFAAIPTDRRRAAARFGHRSWGLHCLFTRVPGALELAEHCPALAAGLAFSNSLRAAVCKPMRSARALLRHPGPHTARKVAGWLGLEPSRAMVRVLRKLEPSRCGVENLRAIKAAMDVATLRKATLHAPRLTQPLLNLMGQMMRPEWDVRLGCGILVELASFSKQDGWFFLWRLQALRRMWGQLWPERSLPVLASVAQVLRLQGRANRASRDPERLSSILGPERGFPSPPLMGGRIDGVQIQPLRSVSDLVAEGHSMRHCIGSVPYLADCVQGRGFAYRVAVEESGASDREGVQATLWLTPGHAQRWELSEIRARRNNAPPQRLRQAVERWLELQDRPRPIDKSAIPESARGRTLRVTRVRGRQSPTGRTRWVPPPPPLGHQLQLGFVVPF